MFSCARSRRFVASIAVVVSMSLLVAAAPPAGAEDIGWVGKGLRHQADASALPADHSEPPPTPDLAVPERDFTDPPTALEGGKEPARFDPAPKRELVEQRTATSETWENADGLSRTTTIYPEPHFFESSQGWEAIDSSVVPVKGRQDVFTNAANSWRVEFAPLDAGGVTVRPGSGPPTSMTPSHRPAIAPLPDEEDASVVRYPDVWAGVDLVYTVLPGGTA